MSRETLKGGSPDPHAAGQSSSLVGSKTVGMAG